MWIGLILLVGVKIRLEIFLEESHFAAPQASESSPRKSTPTKRPLSCWFCELTLIEMPLQLGKPTVSTFMCWNAEIGSVKPTTQEQPICSGLNQK